LHLCSIVADSGSAGRAQNEIRNAGPRPKTSRLRKMLFRHRQRGLCIRARLQSCDKANKMSWALAPEGCLGRNIARLNEFFRSLLGLKLACWSVFVISYADSGRSAYTPAMALQAPTAPQASTAASQATPIQAAASQQAYSLPPDKLAKSIALSRIRNILDIVGSLWQIVFIWMLLASRFAARLEVEIKRIASHPWAQGVFFFAAFLSSSGSQACRSASTGITLAQLPDQHRIVAPNWFSDVAKELGFSIAVSTPCFCSSTGSSAAGRAATGSAHG